MGSPTLAAFSLALTAINAHWADDRFSAINYPNHKNAVKALIYLQQAPLHLTTHDCLLASLVVLPQNDHWWECLVDRLEQTHNWTISAATPIAWVIIAFVFTIIDSSTNLGSLTSYSGGVGSIWLWLVAIVVGWLWIPFSSHDKLKSAIDKAKDLAFVAADDPSTDDVGDPPNADGPRNIYPPRRAYDVSGIQAIRMSEKAEVFTRDATRAAPVFNYARFWEWWCTVEMIARAFERADGNAKDHAPVDRDKEWVLPEDRHTVIHSDNRTGTARQVQEYCGFPVQGGEEPTRALPSGVWKRVFIASVFALGLQWGATGSAAMIMILTPTTGLGCRSGAFVLYGVVSTMIWLTLLLSSYLAHFAQTRCNYGIPRSRFNSVAVAKGLATFLRRLSTLAASCNAIWIVMACVFQFSEFYSTCYCNSSVIGRGTQRAYITITAAGDVYHNTKAKLIGSFVFNGGWIILFLSFLHLMLHETNSS